MANSELVRIHFIIIIIIIIIIITPTAAAAATTTTTTTTTTTIKTCGTESLLNTPSQVYKKLLAFMKPEHSSPCSYSTTIYPVVSHLKPIHALTL
jgi:hypothetical protein